MNKIKLFLGVALFGAMSFGAFTAYDYVTMSAEERFLLTNIEALTDGEPGGGGSGTGITCYNSVERNQQGQGGGVNKCDSYSSPTDCTQYPGYHSASKEARNCTNLH